MRALYLESQVEFRKARKAYRDERDRRDAAFSSMAMKLRRFNKTVPHALEKVVVTSHHSESDYDESFQMARSFHVQLHDSVSQCVHHFTFESQMNHHTLPPHVRRVRGGGKRLDTNLHMRKIVSASLFLVLL